MPFTDPEEGEAKVLVPESQGCVLKRRGGEYAGSCLQGGTGGWGRDSTERVGPGKGEDEHTCACYHLLK